MPKKTTVTKEAIVEAALSLLKRDGKEAINARAVAKELGTSTQPIFSHFANMKELKEAICNQAWVEYERFFQKEIESNKYPTYKASGMAYIKFANAEPTLFNYLFSGSEHAERGDEIFSDMVETVKENKGVQDEEAALFHLQMWIHVHGIAALTSTGQLRLDEKTISKMITNVYNNTKISKD